MKHKILFLAANPVGLEARALGREAHEIHDEIQSASARDRFEFVPRLAAQPRDLLHALRQIKPSIIHFVGHDRADGIYLTGDDNRPTRMTREALKATLGSAGKSVQLVVLNGCATEELGRALCELVPVCVGTSPPIGDHAARTFSAGLYGALASGESVTQACSQGHAAMLLENAGNHAPVLYHRGDIDPGMLVLAGEVAATEPAPVRLGQAATPPGGAAPTRDDPPQLRVRTGADADRLVLVADPQAISSVANPRRSPSPASSSRALRQTPLASHHRRRPTRSATTLHRRSLRQAERGSSPWSRSA